MSHHDVHRYLVTRRIVPEGEANIYDAFPEETKETITEVYHVDGSDPQNIGREGTYGVDLDPETAARVSRATNLIDLVNISEHGMGFYSGDVESLVEESPLRDALEEREIPVGAITPKLWRAGGTLDQGREGSCVGHGCRHHINGEPVMTDPASGPSAVDLYNWAKKNDYWEGENYEGTSVEAGLEALKHYGYIRSVGYTKSYDEMASWLSTQGGLIVGWDWFEGMHRTRSDGYIWATGKQTGRHCVWVRGILANGDVEIQNSWGTGWGQGGFAKLSADTVKWLIPRSGAVAGAVTQVGADSPYHPNLPRISATGFYNGDKDREAVLTWYREDIGHYRPKRLG